MPIPKIAKIININRFTKKLSESFPHDIIFVNIKNNGVNKKFNVINKIINANIFCCLEELFILNKIVNVYKINNIIKIKFIKFITLLKYVECSIIVKYEITKKNVIKV